MKMDQDKLWHNFVHSGKVEDYLRYRGIDPVAQSVNCVKKEESGYGNRPQTASNDRRPDSQGV